MNGFKKHNTPWNKGKRGYHLNLSSERRTALQTQMLGNQYAVGHTNTPAQIAKQLASWRVSGKRIGRKPGFVSPRKGTTIDRTKYPCWGNYKKPSKISRGKMRLARLGVLPWNKNTHGLYTPSAETKAKISVSVRRVLNSSVVHQKMVAFQNSKSVKIARLERIRFQAHFDTDIEIKVQQLLDTLKIPYRKQERIADITVADLYLPDHDLYIFCDGDYWHSMPHMQQKDERQNRLMKRAGIKFIRFWGREILKNTEAVRETLQTVTSISQ